MATLKIQRAVKELGVNGGNLSKAMIKAGYKKRSPMKTEKLTGSKGFKELMEKELPDGMLLKVHKEGLKATTYFTEGLGKGETQLIEKPDYSVRHKYLDTSYKIKGKLKEAEQPNRPPQQTVINMIFPNGNGN